MKALALFIMGSVRSGTTWLENIFCSRPDISSSTYIEHHGIHESSLFDHTRYVFFDDIEWDAFIIEKEDLFELLSLDETIFCENYVGKHGVFYWFSILMEAFAKINNTSYWLEKTPKLFIYYDVILKASLKVSSFFAPDNLIIQKGLGNSPGSLEGMAEIIKKFLSDDSIRTETENRVHELVKANYASESVVNN